MLARTDRARYETAAAEAANANENAIFEVSVNGTEVTPTAASFGGLAVDIGVPVAVSELANDSGFQTAAQVTAAIGAAIGDAIGGSY